MRARVWGGGACPASLRAPPLLLLHWQAAGRPYQVAAYVVDFDRRGRRQSVSVLDGAGLAEVSPPQYVAGEAFAGGTWLVWRYNASLRLRFNLVRGDNQVVSALMFDD